MDLARHLQGLMIGTAVGDALGLPREGLTRRRAQRMFGGAPLSHRLLFGRGMVSDDTEHTCMAAQALLVSGGKPDRFARSMAWRLRGWFLGLPAGVGMATARACLKLWIGFPPSRSGVWSAGNGPAMRAGILGVYAWDDLDLLRDLVDASTRLTHTDPAAANGALAIALGAAYGVARKNQDGDVEASGYLQFIRPLLDGTEILRLIEVALRRLQSGASLEEYLEASGLERGISGYINHTVPACLFCWLANPRDFRAAVERIIVAGGDADTTGAIVGGLAGITAGGDAIPTEWSTTLIEWPRNIAWIARLVDALATDRQSSVKSHRTVPILWTGLMVRNIFFLSIVLIHGLRRLLPPY